MMSRGLQAAVFPCVLLSGCATVPASPSSAKIVVAPSRSLVFSGVRAEARADGLVVRGRVGRRGLMRGPVWGHIHVEAVSGSRTVAWVDTSWSQLARRRLPASFFQARLPDTPNNIDEIRVFHMPNGHPIARRSASPSCSRASVRCAASVKSRLGVKKRLGA